MLVQRMYLGVTALWGVQLDRLLPDGDDEDVELYGERVKVGGEFEVGVDTLVIAALGAHLHLPVIVTF